MRKPVIEKKQSVKSILTDPAQKGTAIVIALFVLALLSVFVAFAVSRTTAETVAIGNESSEARTQYAAQGSLETMTRNFNKVFETKLNPLGTDIALVRNAPVPGLSRTLDPNNCFDFDQRVDRTDAQDIPPVTLPGGPYAGLIAIRDNYRLRTTATNLCDGTQIQLTRNILNNRIPIFQFGIFYNDDLELFRPPRFMFGGRVHSNGNFFVSPGGEGIYFDSRVTTVGHIVTQSWRNWYTGDSANNQTFIRNGSGNWVQLFPNRGSVLNTTAGSANNVFEFPPPFPVPVPTPNADLPPSRLNTNWATDSAVFDGNLRAQVPALRLPLNVGQGTDLIEMVKRGKEVANVNGGDLFMNNAGNLMPVTAAVNEVDNAILRSERFANKTGIRISLADRKEKLPGCASGAGTTEIAGPCGVRLDGDTAGQLTGAFASPRGYQPKSMRSVAGGPFNYTATRVNGDRLFNPGPLCAGTPCRQVWIKVETVRTNAVTGAIVTTDITEDMLSLGVTEEAPADIPITWPANYTGPLTRANNGTPTAPSANLTATVPQAASTYPDSRSIIKIQTFAIRGAGVPTAAAPNSLLTAFAVGGNPYNVVRRYTNATVANISAAPACALCAQDDIAAPNAGSERLAHLKQATVNGVANSAIVPFPIEMFDTREGTYFDNAGNYAAGQVTRNGVMSMIDIDVANLRRFLRGDFNGLFPDGAAGPNSTPFSQNNAGNLGLRACTYANPAPAPCDGVGTPDIPDNGGWVVYVSDRRGDSNFDGEYDMEDIYGNAPGNDGNLQPGEDLDGPVAGGRFGAGVLNVRYIDPNNFNFCIASPIAVPANCEAARYSHTWTPDAAAVADHPYFRRGVRLVNGTVLPGIYNAATPAATKGFTVSSENGIYVKGNYNATGAAAPPALGNTPFNQYFPQDTATHIPASIVADAVTILSNGWNDAQSFITPYDRTQRVARPTQMRFALISGDTISTSEQAVNQGGSVNGENENGGVHNFKRFLEIWTGVRFDYSGSLINLFNSRNNNGAFKCCNTVYNPPIRNWVFDSTFLNPNRIPPGTPFFQYIETTGFERTNE